MATKSTKTKQAASKGAKAAAKKSGSKPAARGKATSDAGKTAKTKPAPKAPQVNAKAGKAVKTANGKQAAPEPDKAKKKPPSITITRPEVTRPPVVLPPPRPLVAPVGVPYILLPKEGQPIPSLTPILRWMYVGGATRYEVEWSHDAHFGRGHSSTIVSIQTAISLDAAHELKPATMYKWRVRGGNDAGWGPWSPPESFRSPEK